MTIISSLLVSISSSNEYKGRKEFGSKPDVPDSSEYTFIFFPTPYGEGEGAGKRNKTKNPTGKDRKKENLEDLACYTRFASVLFTKSFLLKGRNDLMLCIFLQSLSKKHAIFITCADISERI